MIARAKIDMMAEVVQYLREEGFTHEFVIGPEEVVDSQSRRSYRPDTLKVCRIFRFEGKGDIAFFDVLYALQASDGTRGWIVSNCNTPEEARLREYLQQMEGLSGVEIT